jgi:C_GCAxxG_C_C family probable redox protein
MGQEAKVIDAIAQAGQYFSGGFNCTQSVLQALQSYYRLQDQQLWRTATGLGAGMGRQGLTCGAVTGACLAMGLVTSQTKQTQGVLGLKEETYARVSELIRRFEAQFGTTSCRVMTGCDLRTPQGQADFKTNQISDRVCYPAVRLAVEAVIDICNSGEKC